VNGSWGFTPFSIHPEAKSNLTGNLHDIPWHFTFKVKFTDPLLVGSPYPKAWVDDGSGQNFGP
jgi:hypothetical protein